MTDSTMRDALRRVIGVHLGTEVSLRAEPTPISGGFWASIHGFELADPQGALPAAWRDKLVLRVMPDARRAAHEVIVQRKVAEAGFPTPAVLLDGDDPGVGGAFMIMPFSPGRSPLSGLGPRSLLSLPRVLRRLPIQLSDVAIQLHRLDPATLVTALEVAGFGGGGDGAESRLAAIAVAAATDSRGFDDVLAWFAERRPVDPPVVVCHGDLHPFNLLVDGATTTVLDWTNADLMPREFEVGFTAGFLRCAPISIPKFAQPVLRRLTGWLGNRFVETYRRQAPLDDQRLLWFEALQYARCLAEVATARAGLTDIVGAMHPFEISAEAMIAHLHAITEVLISLAPRQPAPAN